MNFKNNAILSLIGVLACLNRVTTSQESQTIQIKMPGSLPDADDTYTCTAFKIGGEDRTKSLFITKFTALAKMAKAHHLILQKCKAPMKRPGETWDCRHHAICRGDTNVLYAWAKNAPPTEVPENVGFEIEPDDYIVLQVHYAHPLSVKDYSGAELEITYKQPKYFAGIYLLVKGFLNMPPHKPRINGDLSCILDNQKPLHIFAFRPHAHKLSERILGFKMDDKGQNSELIAVGDPQRPQAFYPLEHEVTVSAGETLLARCIYNTTTQDTMTRIGATAGDEMCNLYLMFYSEARNQQFFVCMREDRPVPDIPESQMDAKLQVFYKNVPKLEHFRENSSQENREPKQMSTRPVYTRRALKIPKFVGDIASVAFDIFGNIMILHRGEYHWDGFTFNRNNEYLKNKTAPIQSDVLVTLDPEGNVLHRWGAGRFYLPHMVTVDQENNVWITDVALHQVFKFGPYGGSDLIQLGEAFVPGNDDLHFCKPTSVAVTSDSRTFFVSDGYCNSRIVQYRIQNINENGYHTVYKVMTIDKATQSGGTIPQTFYQFIVPHKLTLMEKENLVCVADRENGRVLCFDMTTGQFKKQIYDSNHQERIYSISYPEGEGANMSILKGPNSRTQNRLSLIDTTDNNFPETQMQGPIGNPHDVAVTVNSEAIAVAELNPPGVWLYEDLKALKPELPKLGKSTERMKDDSVVATPAVIYKGESSFYRGIGIGAIILSVVVVLIYVIKRRSKFNDNIKNASELVNSKKGFQLLPDGEEEIMIDSDSD